MSQNSQPQKVDITGKYVAIPAEIFLQVVNYLTTKPFQEVGTLVPALNESVILIEKPEVQAPDVSKSKSDKETTSNAELETVK